MTLVWLVLAATPVHVSNIGCRLKVDEVQRLTQLELIRGPDRSLPVVLFCDATTLKVTIDDPITKKTLARTLPLELAPQRALERFTALAIAELAEASWSELLLAPQPVSAASVDTSAAKDAVKTLPTTKVRLQALAHARGYPAGGVVQFGGGARAHVGFPGPLGLFVDVLAETGTLRTNQGPISADGVGGGAFFTLRLPLRVVQLLGGVGARAWGQRMVGRADDGAPVEGKTISTVLFGPALVGEASIAFGRVELSVTVESGVLIRGLVATFDGARLAALTGPWLCAAIGVGWQL